MTELKLCHIFEQPPKGGHLQEVVNSDPGPSTLMRFRLKAHTLWCDFAYCPQYKNSLRSNRFRRIFTARNFGCAGNGARSHLCFALALLPAHPKFRTLKTSRKRLLRRLPLKRPKESFENGFKSDFWKRVVLKPLRYKSGEIFCFVFEEMKTNTFESMFVWKGLKDVPYPIN